MDSTKPSVAAILAIRNVRVERFDSMQPGCVKAFGVVICGLYSTAAFGRYAVAAKDHIVSLWGCAQAPIPTLPLSLASEADAGRLITPELHRMPRSRSRVEQRSFCP
jgi:hypothetical protein